MIHQLAVVTLALALSSGYAQTKDSLRSKARAKGGVGTNQLTVHAGPRSVSELSKRAQLIAHGRVTSVRSHLTPDESFVVTDVTVEPIRLLKEDISVLTRRQPGGTKALIVRHLGGTVTEGELTMTTSVNLFPLDERLVSGDEVICFLRYNEAERVFELIEGPFAAFRVREGRVHALNREAQRASGGQERSSLSRFLADVDVNVRAPK